MDVVATVVLRSVTYRGAFVMLIYLNVLAAIGILVYMFVTRVHAVMKDNPLLYDKDGWIDPNMETIYKAANQAVMVLVIGYNIALLCCFAAVSVSTKTRIGFWMCMAAFAFMVSMAVWTTTKMYEAVSLVEIEADSNSTSLTYEQLSLLLATYTYSAYTCTLLTCATGVGVLVLFSLKV